MTDIVCDSSILVSMLIDSGEAGTWAARTLVSHHLVAPHLAIVEAANVLRRHLAAGSFGEDVAVQAHDDLVDLTIEFWPYEPLADRVWQLRHNLTVYDATYVALGEMLEAPVATLDRRIARCPGIRCAVLTP